MNTKERLSFVIPCYGSENTIEDVVSEIKDVMKKQENEYDFEIILINDGSPDKVWEKIQKIVKENINIIGISFSKNFGQHAALMAGYRKVSGDIVITLDDDGQSPVDEVFSLVNKIHQGYDVVYAKYDQIKQSKWRIWGSWINNKMSEILLEKPKEIVGNSFYAMRKYILEEIINYKNAYPYIGGLVFRTTKTITNVVVKQRERKEGKSGYTFLKLVTLWLNGFTAFSEKPLRMAAIFGFICAGIGFIYGMIVIIRKFINPMTQIGYSSLMAVILFVGGILMLLLGLIGEYIGRIYICLNNAPQYVIKDTIENRITQNKERER